MKKTETQRAVTDAEDKKSGENLKNEEEKQGRSLFKRQQEVMLCHLACEL